tara:strand:+ start:2966 stop:3145 length:180 start_codon:yes stop_codon:yes gene_type:complete
MMGIDHVRPYNVTVRRFERCGTGFWSISRVKSPDSGELEKYQTTRKKAGPQGPAFLAQV